MKQAIPTVRFTLALPPDINQKLLDKVEKDKKKGKKSSRTQVINSIIGDHLR